ncbi:MAG: SDR family NAD(P)-dependent oxidoreductase [Flavobacteriales bacterium]|jgi:NAD(P)-dependent dehydrogenase (short-subunit alcohol dehydrogenase family)|nr:SDR family NAD(P)-dependent oxidoreductase [Flavobacteriales bacterium]
MKSILITGSTDGIGKLAALKLAKEGHQIYLHGRNKDKLETVIQEIKTQSNNDKINGFVADLSDLETVKEFAKSINEIPQLDVLINNAGVFKSNIDRTVDIRLTVNYLSPVLLTNSLIELLQKTKSTRVINLSSAAQVSVSLAALKGHESLSTNEAYAQSKLALTMWTFAMAKKYPAIQFIAVNPGSLLNTNMVKEAYGHHWSPADKGADILVDLAINPKHQNQSGVYFDNDQGVFGKAHTDAYDNFKIQELIAVTAKILKL